MRPNLLSASFLMSALLFGGVGLFGGAAFAAPGAAVCAPSTSMTATKTSFKHSKAAGLTAESLVFAKAMWKKDKSRLVVYISNKDWTMAELVSRERVQKQAADASVVLSFYQNKGSKVESGAYPVGYNLMTMPRMETSINTFDTSVSVMLEEAGQVTITQVDDTHVCGTFDLTEWGMFSADDPAPRLVGTFVAPIVAP